MTVAQKRPEFHNINAFKDLPSYRWPVASIVSGMHRFSGVLMFALLPLIIWMFDTSVSSEISFARFRHAFENGAWGVLLKLVTKDKAGKLTYGVTGRHYQKNYTAPVLFNQNSNVVALYTNKKGVMDTAVFDLRINKATGKKITLAANASRAYPGDGAFTLVNGLQNTVGLKRSRDFLGFNNSNLEATIDLGSLQKVEKVIVHTLTNVGDWIYAPTGGEVWTSADGKDFKKAAANVQIVAGQNGKGQLQLSLSPLTTRFVKIVVTRLPVIPAGNPGAGSKAWLFADEIEIH